MNTAATVPSSRARCPARTEGFTLVETVLALSLLTVVALGLLPLGVVATSTTENQGHLMARTTEYAQDKMEQLLALSYGDTTTDTRTFPSGSTGGTGLALGGSDDPAAPVALYVDYLDINGTLIPSAGTTAPTNWYYKRVWRVASVGVNLKRVTVTATVKSAVGSTGRVPSATVAAIKTFPF